ncbi:TPA: ComEC/Rec2 family competence protein [Clostridium perfringens]|uniref:ComEC/Rec2 family competence protein n=1 Tax=Clostridium perfringens TaxID=1502 RepID=UPI0018996C49|nr:ComEC/Rec2 family competence protein [Clostridium perfringens]MDM0948661.1 ComEC/Rec2 family competence protein [Clostridium perfringens]MDM0968031.1 ComEC/Rec2 family competence protein [Clostridium perfringens]MEA5272199.1 ComEC/Rec2 family competence protein [Clostridium perfringens]MEA5312251.1 ComEC/Rec2 family competence protein [Clostridium perfringens]MEA5342618.1 ComEC/Rec2 family competence protein [Clostridium perfringens]
MDKKKKIISSIIGIIVVLLAGYFGIDLTQDSKVPKDSKLMISYMDVGQGDAAYIKVNGNDILIDTGPRSNSKELLEQLKAKNIDDFELVIATHPHEDHIGGMVDVFKEYEVKAFYSPKITHTTKTYENLVKAVKDEGLKTKELKGGMVIDLGEGAKFEVFTPQKSEYEELNDYSPIMKLSFGDTSYLFTGDAEKLAEEEALAKYKTSLDSDVIKFGHHGSSSSSSNAFIEAVSPKYGIISCAKDNKYGHPHRETLDIIKKYNIKTFRTDTDGEIILTSDGKSINFNK